jgi:hypothetical protein
MKVVIWRLKRLQTHFYCCMCVGVGVCDETSCCFINQPLACNSKASTLSAVNSGVRLLVNS